MKKILYILLFVVLSNAQTTICYKDGVTSPSVMETTKLDGSLCDGKTIKDMQKDGWSIKDIQMLKIDNKLNFVYIFTQNKPTTTTKLEQPQVDMKKAKKMFVARCSRCHKKDDKEFDKYKVFDDFIFKLEQYGRNDIDSNNAFLMEPVANSLTEDDTKIIFEYIKKDTNK
jgi:cytochrome c553